MDSVLKTDVVVVGAGAAGLYTALNAERAGANVTLISALPLAESASYWAQGGLAVALAADDSPAIHFDDTVKAGRGAVHEAAARVLCAEANLVLRDLTDLGVAWDRDRFGRPALGLEGGHSVRRIVHAGGAATGRRITRALSAAAAAAPGLTVLEGRRVSALLGDGTSCAGVVLDGGDRIEARAVVLATGGAAALWSRTTNPPGTVGRGIVLAHSAGAALADLELIQFHPTALAAGTRQDGLLVTEAIRGEGATLTDAQGNRFTDELAPRDEVSLTVAERILSEGSNSVFLDMRNIEPRHFPNVFASLSAAGIDATRELVPVAPAAHYLMGGIATDTSGRSTLDGLFAVGECACTGLHGANRLASNSLTECFVFGRRAALAALDRQVRPHGALEAIPCDPAVVPSDATREALWRHAGLVRDAAGLSLLLDDPHPLTRLIAASALERRESRGAHRRSDFPEADPRLDGAHSSITLGGNAAMHRWDGDDWRSSQSAIAPTPQLS
ncbi:MAG: FAD-dependent oxidoreductase [Actinomycetes bacterium]|nr:FAD-dependent oxidoreductase [Solirubrobacterales bacterium]